jgi:hypothetical protein
MRWTVLLVIASYACGDLEVEVPSESVLWPIDRRDVGAAGDAEHGLLVTVATADRYIAAADGQAASLAIFDRTGAFIRRSGRSGQGPGEFASISALLPYRGDSVVVYDGMMQRLTVAPVAGGEPRAVVMPLGREAHLQGVIDDSVFVMSAAWRRAPMSAQGLYRDSVALVTVSPTGHGIDTIGHFADRFLAGGPEKLFVLLSPAARFAASRDRLCYADTMLPRVECSDHKSKGTTVLTWPQAKRPVTTGLRERYLEYYLEHAPPFPRDQLRERLKSVLWLDTLPAIGYPLLMEYDGTVWVPEYQLPSDWAPKTWRVLSVRGELLARVITPPEFQLTSIDGDVLWGVWRDSLDVTTIRSYAVHRDARPHNF